MQNLNNTSNYKAMNEFLSYVIFTFDGFSLKVLAIFKLLLWIITVLIFLKLIKTLLYRSKRFDQAKKFSIYALTKYIIVVISFIIGLHLLGMNISLLLAGSAALLVGFGLGMQNLFSDYISGLVILIDSSIKVGDVLDVRGLVCRVEEINLRTTTVYARDGKYIILPNTELTKNQIINWTLNEVTSRFDIAIGVDYDSDIDQVMQIMLDVLLSFNQIKSEPKPFVRLEEFSDSAIIFKLLFWSDEVFRIESIKSQCRILIFKEFQKHNIQIPFPQRVVHIKTQIKENL